MFSSVFMVFNVKLLGWRFLVVLFYGLFLCYVGENVTSVYFLYTWVVFFLSYLFFNGFMSFFSNILNWSQLQFLNWIILLNLWGTSGSLLCLSYNSDVSALVSSIFKNSLCFRFASDSFFYFDTYSLMFVFLMTTIALYVVPYSTSYLYQETTAKRFYFCLNGFIGGMIILVLANNMVVLILGWELIGWFSFFLISNYTVSAKSQLASNKVLFFNKFSDSGIFLFVCVYMFFFNPSLMTGGNFWEVFVNAYVTKAVQFTWIECIFIGLIVASFVKSAHFGLHLWLPDSMEAPMPASALIHSATLVSAGVYLMGRLKLIVLMNPIVYDIIILWAGFTAFIGALVGSYQTDFKKTLAYSTISHCGFLMLLALGDNLQILYIYLVVHGLLKSFSFVLGGDMILQSNNYQDWRKSGMYMMNSRIKFILLMMSVSGLAGLPFGMGFFGKNAFLLTQVVGGPANLTVSSVLFVLASALGLVYTVSLNSFIFFSRYSGFFNYHSIIASKNFSSVTYFSKLCRNYNLQKVFYYIVSLVFMYMYMMNLGIMTGVIEFDQIPEPNINYFGTYSIISIYEGYLPANLMLNIYVTLSTAVLLVFMMKKYNLFSFTFVFMYVYMFGILMWLYIMCFGYTLFI